MRSWPCVGLETATPMSQSSSEVVPTSELKQYFGNDNNGTKGTGTAKSTRTTNTISIGRTGY
eukprot:1529701-Rhodomonas_salina.1